MYSEEWEPAMTANTMEERIEELAKIARRRVEEDDASLEDVVYKMVHNSYLLKHTTGDVLRELAELESLYPDAFHDGDANTHVVSNLNEVDDFEFWSDYVFLTLASSLEWAILDELNQKTTAI